MKSLLKNLLLSITVLCLAVSLAAGAGTSNLNATTPSLTPVGGAFLVFAGKNGGEIKKSEMTGQRELKVDGCAKGSKVFTFTLEVVKKGTKTTLEAGSNVLTSEMVSVLQKLSPGDTFEFKEMKAYLPNGKDIVDVHGRKFVVV